MEPILSGSASVVSSLKSFVYLMSILPVILIGTSCVKSEPQDMTFDVTIAGGTWDVTGDVIKVNQGDHVTINVESDVKGGIHIHGYDLFNEVAPDAPLTFDFDASATGKFEIMFHPFSLARNLSKGHGGADGHGHDDHGESEVAMEPENDPKEMEMSLGSLQVFP